MAAHVDQQARQLRPHRVERTLEAPAGGNHAVAHLHAGAGRAAAGPAHRSGRGPVGGDPGRELRLPEVGHEHLDRAQLGTADERAAVLVPAPTQHGERRLGGWAPHVRRRTGAGRLALWLWPWTLPWARRGARSLPAAAAQFHQPWRGEDSGQLRPTRASPCAGCRRRLSATRGRWARRRCLRARAWRTPRRERWARDRPRARHRRRRAWRARPWPRRSRARVRRGWPSTSVGEAPVECQACRDANRRTTPSSSSSARSKGTLSRRSSMRPQACATVVRSR